MIWSLIKILMFIALVAALTFGVAFVIDTGGQVTVTVGNLELGLTPLAGLVGILAILLVGWIAFRLTGLLLAVFRFFNGDETALSRYFDRNRERRGYQALADGLMALASGEGRLAMSLAAKAEKFLDRPDLTLLLSAQSAEMSGETARAQQYYKKLISDDRTRFVGIQGVLKQRLAEGDTETAFKLAEKAFALRPRHETTQDLLFSLQSARADWEGARKTLAAKLSAKTLPRDVHKRRDAVLALAEAREKLNAGDVDAGRAAAFQANRLSPDLVPAAVLAAEIHIATGAVRNAAKLLKKAWSATPHPDLAATFAEIAPNETPDERLSRFRPLLKLAPDHPETRMLEAELNIVAEDFPAARKAMGDLAENAPTTRTLTVMAAIERGEGAPDNVVRGWLARALDASRGPEWVCTSCNTTHGDWQAVCSHCGHFDTLAWAVPHKGSGEQKHTTDMLPLIVGALEDHAETDRDDEAIAAKDAEGDQSGHADSAGDQAPSEDMDGIIGDVRVIPGFPPEHRDD